MGLAWKYTEKAADDLKRLDERIAIRIAKKIRISCASDNPFAFAKSLNGEWKGIFRFSIGDYRVLFRKASEGSLIILLILRIKHRKDVYE